jgi:hypothetical protein
MAFLNHPQNVFNKGTLKRTRELWLADALNARGSTRYGQGIARLVVVRHGASSVSQTATAFARALA